MQIQGVYENYCENCQQQGHRTWACPFQAKSHVSVKCSICGQTSHPTSDCPEKQAYLKKQQTDQIAMLLQSQYHQFKEDLNVTKPKGGTAFITDFEKKDVLAITHGAPQAKEDEAKKANPIALAPPPAKKPQAARVVENNDLPKFQDD